jgi:hypothetical protein
MAGKRKLRLRSLRFQFSAHHIPISREQLRQLAAIRFVIVDFNADPSGKGTRFQNSGEYYVFACLNVELEPAARA